MDAQSESSSSSGQREQCFRGARTCSSTGLDDIDLSKVEVCPASSSGGSHAGDWRRPLGSEDRVLLA